MRIHDSETNKCKKKLMLEPKEFEQGIEYQGNRSIISTCYLFILRVV